MAWTYVGTLPTDPATATAAERRDWVRTKVGDVVSVVGNPGKREPDKLLLGRELFKEDGTYLPLNISSRSIYTETTATATSIAGTWFPPRTSFFSFLGGQQKWQISDAGKAAIQQSASLPTPQKDCQPIGEPALLFYPVANVIEVFDNRVEMHIDWLDSERTVWLDGRAHPSPDQTFPHGHSVGRFAQFLMERYAFFHRYTCQRLQIAELAHQSILRDL